MTKPHNAQSPCAVCGKLFPVRDLIPDALVQDTISSLIHRDHPAWSSESYICRADLAKYSTEYVKSLLESERGELSSIETKVLESLRQHELLSMNVGLESEDTWTFGERLSDKLADFTGSWTFLIIFGVFMAIWIIMNSLVLFWRPVDPYPYILLNLLLSCLAAIQAPVIMMSQNRQETRDRLRAQHDYQVNLKAELEIRHLNEKLDHMLSHQWERLVQIQQVQMQMLAQIEKR
jgi:uncharacterized membrane protein